VFSTSSPPDHHPKASASSSPLDHHPKASASSSPLDHHPKASASSSPLDHHPKASASSSPLDHHPKAPADSAALTRCAPRLAPLACGACFVTPAESAAPFSPVPRHTAPQPRTSPADSLRDLRSLRSSLARVGVARADSQGSTRDPHRRGRMSTVRHRGSLRSAFWVASIRLGGLSGGLSVRRIAARGPSSRSVDRPRGRWIVLAVGGSSSQLVDRPRGRWIVRRVVRGRHGDQQLSGCPP
jgi:hypothetical protein